MNLATSTLNQTSSSIFVAIKRIRTLIERKEKIKFIFIVLFAIFNSCLEVISASVVVLFAQILTNPSSANKYFNYVGLNNISPNRAIFYVAILFGGVYLFKNIFCAFETLHQHTSVQKIHYLFKKRLLGKYANVSYELYLTRNSSVGYQVVNQDTEILFSSGLIAFSAICSEALVFIFLTGTIVYLNPQLAFVLAILGVPLYFFITKVFFPIFYKWGKNLQDQNVLIHKNLIYFFNGFKEIILLGKINYFVDNYVKHAQVKAKISALRDATNNFPRIVLEVIFAFLFVQFLRQHLLIAHCFF